MEEDDVRVYGDPIGRYSPENGIEVTMPLSQEPPTQWRESFLEALPTNMLLRSIEFQGTNLLLAGVPDGDALAELTNKQIREAMNVANAVMGRYRDQAEKERRRQAELLQRMQDRADRIAEKFADRSVKEA